MTLNLSMPQTLPHLRPHVLVFGIGGAGCNAVNNMLNANIEGVKYVVANTDAQSLAESKCDSQIQLGLKSTEGLGAGCRPEIGRASAEEEIDQIAQHLQGNHIVFITAGFGGGTGTGAAPVVARSARDNNILTVGIVTMPFNFEGSRRMRLAEEGLQELQNVVDTLIIIPNQNLFEVVDEHTTFADAARMADDVLVSGVRSITGLMVLPGLINLDFADVRTVMSEMGKAMMGVGEADGEGRAIKAAEAAIANPLLDEISIKGARGLLINISGGPDLTLYEVNDAANRVRDEVDPTANIVFGSAFDRELQGKIRVSVFATGIESATTAMQWPTDVKLLKPAAAHEIEHDPLLDQVSDCPVETIETQAPPQVAASEIADSSEQPDDSTQSDMFSEAAADTAEEENHIHAISHHEVEAATGILSEGLSTEEAAVESLNGQRKGTVTMLPSAETGQIIQDTRPQLALRPEPRYETCSKEGIKHEPAPAEKEEAIAGTRASMFSFLLNRRKKPSADQNGAQQNDRVSDEVEDNSEEDAAAKPQIDNGIRLVTSKVDMTTDDDLLEIPAFLRRQAN